MIKVIYYYYYYLRTDKFHFGQQVDSYCNVHVGSPVKFHFL